jgi:hypothetical protein
MPFVVGGGVEALTQPRMQHDVAAWWRVTCVGLVRSAFGDPSRERRAEQLRNAGVLAFVVQHRSPAVLREAPIDL